MKSDHEIVFKENLYCHVDMEFMSIVLLAEIFGNRPPEYKN